MRIRNRRPSASLFPPCPDLNLNHSFPSSPPQTPNQNQQTLPPVVQQKQHQNQVTTTADGPDINSAISSMHDGVKIAPDLREKLLREEDSLEKSRGGFEMVNKPTSSREEDDRRDDDDSSRVQRSSEDSATQLVNHSSDTKVEKPSEEEEEEEPRPSELIVTKANLVKDTQFVIANSNEKEPTTETESRTVGSSNGVKKRGSRLGGLVLVEGSRCSRVNGRGWRCSQQTLVGYSLCEHHLGKSRLRTLTSVKNINTSSSTDVASNVKTSSGRNAKTASSTKKRGRQQRDLGVVSLDESDTDDDDNFLIPGRKKSRMGTVKARSLSSLLSKTTPLNGVLPEH